MTEQWQELKETIIEMRDNNGTGTQQEVCKFLANYMEVLEKQTQEPCEDAIGRQAVLDVMRKNHRSGGRDIDGDYVEGDYRECLYDDIISIPSINSQPKTGNWVYKIYGGFHEQGDWYCSHCDYQFNYGNGHAEYCPKCGFKMSEAPTEEVKRI